MKTLFKAAGLCLFFICSAHYAAQAQDFVYEPVNSAFGGNYLNYSWMLQSATAQNSFKDPEETAGGLNQDPLKNFEENLNRQILSQIARQIVSSQFGEEGLQEGQYIFGNYIINIGSDASGINISIEDTGTGNGTTVVIPYF